MLRCTLYMCHIHAIHKHIKRDAHILTTLCIHICAPLQKRPFGPAAQPSS